MKLTEKEKIQEQLSVLRRISKNLFYNGDPYLGQDVTEAVNKISEIIKTI